MLLLLATLFAHAECEPPIVWPADGQVDVPIVHQSVFWKWDDDSDCQVHAIRMWELDSGEEVRISASGQSGSYGERLNTNVSYRVTVEFSEGELPHEQRELDFTWEFSVGDVRQGLGLGTFAPLDVNIEVFKEDEERVTGTTAYTDGHPDDLILFRRNGPGVVDWAQASDLAGDGQVRFEEQFWSRQWTEECWEASVATSDFTRGARTDRICYTRGCGRTGPNAISDGSGGLAPGLGLVGLVLFRRREDEGVGLTPPHTG